MITILMTLLVALLHLYFLVLEAFRWEHPRTRKIFGTTEELAAQTKVMAANQGLYNAFLGVGLIFGLATGNTQMTAFLLICVVVAGIVGGLSVHLRVFIVQSVPALLALGALWFGV